MLDLWFCGILYCKEFPYIFTSCAGLEELLSKYIHRNGFCNGLTPTQVSSLSLYDCCVQCNSDVACVMFMYQPGGGMY